MKFSVNIKSGTGGWFDYEGCDMEITDFESNNIPNVGDILDIEIDGEIKSYLVREIRRHYKIYDVPKEKENENHKYKEFITVYVIPY